MQQIRGLWAWWRGPCSGPGLHRGYSAAGGAGLWRRLALRGRGWPLAAGQGPGRVSMGLLLNIVLGIIGSGVVSLAVRLPRHHLRRLDWRAHRQLGLMV